MSRSALLDELGWRGLVHLSSEGLEQRLEQGPVSAYIGFDASATSLHVGHLLQVFLLTHLQRAGGRPVVLIGGGTGMIGDPSGKSSERVLLDADAIERNSAALKAQLERFLDFSPGPTQPRMLNNLDWLGQMSMIDYLRDIGKYFTVPYMLSKDSVQARLAAGMSFTEFSYQTLQAADFLHLHQHEGVDMQMGGADQWGNITAGLELIRRVESRAAEGT
ncbi:MAG: tyrosine--tRNA ligase, partial [Candidatus Limnocylindrales bacterium]